MPFRRTPSSGGTDARIASLEYDIDRLIGGWNQHLPQILASVSEARQVARQTQARTEHIQELELRVDRLAAQLDAFQARLDRLSEHFPPDADGRVAERNAARSGGQGSRLP